MLQNVFTVGTQVVILFVLIAVGFGANKAKIINDKTVAGMTDLILYIVTPCVIINSYQREFDPAMLKALIIAAAASIASFALNIVIAHLAIRDKDKRREKVLRMGVVFSNCGYMSLPLQSALLGSEGVFYGATYVALFNIVLWTYGAAVMSGDVRSISMKKILFNPGIIGTVFGVGLFISSVALPSVIREPISYLAALNTPIPMMIIGYRLASASLKIKGFNAYLAMFLRLIATPLIFLLGLYMFGIGGALAVSLTVAVSAPCAAATTMFSEKFGGDTSLSAAMVSVTTIISVITMPLIVGLASLISS